MTETLMSIKILVSATGHLVLASIYDYLPLLPILFFIHSQQISSAGLDFFFFLEERPIPSFMVGVCPWSSCID